MQSSKETSPKVYSSTDAMAILNKGLGCFICTLCPLPVTAAKSHDSPSLTNNNDSVFVSFEKEEFLHHVCEKHDSKTHLICVYCHHIVSVERYTHHVEMHLAMKSRPAPLPFRCPYSRNCYEGASGGIEGSSTFFGSITELLAHKEMFHLPLNYEESDEKPDPWLLTGIECEECGEQFEQERSYLDHLQKTCITLYHCLFPSCLVKSTDPHQLIDHSKTHHSTEALGITATKERICNDLWNSFNSQRHGIVSTCGHYACLHCSYTTLTRSNFHEHLSHNCLVLHSSSQQYLRHAAATITPSNEPNSSVTHIPYTLYHCLLCCHFESTELHLLQEHIHLHHEEVTKMEKVDLSSRFIRQERIIVPLVLRTSLQSTRSTVPKTTPLTPSSSVSSLRRSSAVASEPMTRSKTIVDVDIKSDINSNKVDRMKYPFLTSKEFISSPETIALPFYEEAFLNDYQGSAEERDRLVKAMQQFSQFRVSILGRLKHRRIPSCPVCGKVFEHGVGDVKRHILTQHLRVSGEALQFCLRYTRTSTAGVMNEPDKPSTQSGKWPLPHLDDIVTPQVNVQIDDQSSRLITLPHSSRALYDLVRPEASDEVLEQVQTKMRQYSQHKVLIQSKDSQRVYHCTECAYNSIHCLADVRKHVMGIHCGIPNRFIRFCLQASRLDRNDFRLFNYEKLMSWVDSKSSPAIPNGSTKADVNGSSANKKRPLSSKPSTSSHGSPSATPASDSGNHSDDLEGAGGSDEEPPNKRPKAALRHSIENFVGTDNGASNAVKEEGMQSERIALPFSENVLRILIRRYMKKHAHIYSNGENADCDVNMLVQRMRVYSTYYVLHNYINNVTQSFSCQCGHVFQVAKLPGSKNRPATLSDCRRHVLGVHAKLPSEFLTLCCQASRLNRHRNFEIYSDAELLEFSSNTPSRASSSVGAPSTIPQGSSSKEQPAKGKASGTSLKHSLSINSSTPKALVSRKTDRYSLGNMGALRDSEDDIGCDGLSRIAHHGVTEVEKVIALPYSSTALRTILKDYLPPEMIPFLEHKMRIYSSYKVLVKKIEGKRYLCCSGCTSSSVYGIGDIRKHILGVHAKVPERYKSACLCCSRLSRDDYSLLSESQLVGENAMKWKGYPIKPWNELSDSERKSLMMMANINFISNDGSSSTPSGEEGPEGAGIYCAAASQKEPLKLKISRQEPPVTTKPSNSGSTNRFSSISMVGRNGLLLGNISLLSNSNTVTPPPSLTIHENSENMDNSVSDERTPPLMDTIEEDSNADDGMAECEYAIIEGISTSNEDPVKEVPYFSCSDCGDSVGSFSKADVKAHILRHHLDIMPYRCSECSNLTLSNRAQVLSHIADSHPSFHGQVDESLLGYQNPVYKSTARSIPTRQTSSLTPDNDVAALSPLPHALGSGSSPHIGNNMNKHRRKRPPVKSSLIGDVNGAPPHDVVVVLPKSPPALV